MKTITIYKINKIKYCLLRIFEAEDDDIPNRRIISANERAIDNYLKDYTKEEKDELLKVINWTNDNCVNGLEKLGWVIKRGIRR